MSTDTTFTVDRVFRLIGRKGPVVIGRFAPIDALDGRRMNEVLGSSLVDIDDPASAFEVIGVEAHSTDGLRSLMVRPDLGDSALVGKAFRLVASSDIARR